MAEKITVATDYDQEIYMCSGSKTEVLNELASRSVNIEHCQIIYDGTDVVAYWNGE